MIYGLLPGMLLLGMIGVGLFFWAVRDGQYDDMDGAASRILMDDDIESQGRSIEVEQKNSQQDTEQH